MTACSAVSTTDIVLGVQAKTAEGRLHVFDSLQVGDAKTVSLGLLYWPCDDIEVLSQANMCMLDCRHRWMCS